jgi:excisionase family DNA binding protein
MAEIQKIAFTIDEAIAAAGVSRRTLYASMAKGELPFAFVAGRRRIAPERLRAWILGEPVSSEAGVSLRSAQVSN